MKKMLIQGAESRIFVQEYLGKIMIAKERFKKSYRHPDLDNILNTERIRAECRNILRCKQYGIRTPAIYFVDLDKKIIYMEYFEKSVSVKDYIVSLEEHGHLTPEKVNEIARLIGDVVGKMHSHDLVHGDLTTSNFLLIKDEITGKNDIVVIDFGLSYLGASDEDKGVDLYLLERALSSLNINTTEFFLEVMKKYKSVYGKKIDSILEKYEEVRMRGRKRSMVG